MSVFIIPDCAAMSLGRDSVILELGCWRSIGVFCTAPPPWEGRGDKKMP